MTNEITLAQIETATKNYAAQHDLLTAIVRQVNEQIEAIRKNAIPRIKRAVANTAEAQNQLHTLVSDAPHLFTKPRTVIFHGIKVGFEKGKGKIEFDDVDKTVALIKKHLPEQAEIPDPASLCKLPRQRQLDSRRRKHLRISCSP